MALEAIKGQRTVNEIASEVYLKEYASAADLRRSLKTFLSFTTLSGPNRGPRKPKVFGVAISRIKDEPRRRFTLGQTQFRVWPPKPKALS